MEKENLIELKKDTKMTNKNKQKSEYEDIKLSTRTVLIVLWITLMLLYLYSDFFTFMQPGMINWIIAGHMGPFQATQISLIMAGLLMTIPSLTIVANLFVKLPVIRWINIIVAIFSILVNNGAIIGEKWIFHFIYNAIETVIAVLIIIISVKWKKINSNLD